MQFYNLVEYPHLKKKKKSETLKEERKNGKYALI